MMKNIFVIFLVIFVGSSSFATSEKVRIAIDSAITKLSEAMEVPVKRVDLPNGEIGAQFGDGPVLTSIEIIALHFAVIDARIRNNVHAGLAKPNALRKIFLPTAVSRNGLNEFQQNGSSTITTAAGSTVINKNGRRVEIAIGVGSQFPFRMGFDLREETTAVNSPTHTRVLPEPAAS